MSPSGFNKKAVEGLLVFLEGCYEDLLKEMKSGKSPEEAIENELIEIKSFLRDFKINK